MTYRKASLAALSVAAGLSLLGGPAIAQAQPIEASPPASTQDDVVAPQGTTCIQNCTGYVGSNVRDKRSNQSFTFYADYRSAGGVQNPRLQVRMIGFQGQLVAEENAYWNGRRFFDEFSRGRSYTQPVGSVCTTVWESGIQLGTACAPV